MPGLLADNNVEGQVKLLLQICQTSRWRELWDSLNLVVETFEDLGLSRDASDLVLWQTCQVHELVLITANRNYDRPDSMEAAIRNFNTPVSLPVITLADPKRILESGDYAERVVERILEYLIDLERYRGTGRLFVP